MRVESDARATSMRATPSRLAPGVLTMIDHISLNVRDYEASKAFYLKALAPLGYALFREYEGRVAGLGEGGKPDFWLSGGEAGKPVHVAFVAKSRGIVDAFYKAAI